MECSKGTNLEKNHCFVIGEFQWSLYLETSLGIDFDHYRNMDLQEALPHFTSLVLRKLGPGKK